MALAKFHAAEQREREILEQIHSHSETQGEEEYAPDPADYPEPDYEVPEDYPEPDYSHLEADLSEEDPGDYAQFPDMEPMELSPELHEIDLEDEDPIFEEPEEEVEAAIDLEKVRESDEP
ncbi:MAG TPA: hypothetical protein VHI93_07010 [Candidatus Thermoplasmatota archaeon]|nr:hypothetical protein [Candidatus Thermoplasmatota archaeon]